MPSTRSASIPTEEVELVEEVAVPQEIDYSSMTVAQLREIAKNKGIEGYSSMKKAELIEKLG